MSARAQTVRLNPSQYRVLDRASPRARRERIRHARQGRRSGLPRHASRYRQGRSIPRNGARDRHSRSAWSRPNGCSTAPCSPPARPTPTPAMPRSEPARPDEVIAAEARAAFERQRWLAQEFEP